ncbi:hypothetical protein IMZ68_07540 [Candidatus Bathyarchaeota archaeon]|nr:hypothetical protein [Candidatus Bathyarchaeota archaeon]
MAVSAKDTATSINGTSGPAKKEKAAGVGEGEGVKVGVGEIAGCAAVKLTYFAYAKMKHKNPPVRVRANLCFFINAN